jgi:small subunit ribosomal protein S2
MKPFIFEQRNQIYIINLDETVKQLHRATEFLQEVARRGGKILFVGCKKQAQEAIKEAALACGQFYVNQRWLGGTLTNLATIRKSIGRLKYIEQIEQSPEYKKMGKQELAALNREAAKLRRNLEGILEMAQLPDAVVIIDTTREQNAVNEAKRLNIPIVAIVDTNADPEMIDSGKRRRDSCDSNRVAETCRCDCFGERRSTDSRANRDGWRFCLTGDTLSPTLNVQDFQ